MESDENTRQKFPHITQLAYEALLDTALITGDTWTEVINKALQVHKAAYAAEIAGGYFVIQGPDGPPERPRYEATGSIRISLLVNLSPESVYALDLVVPTRPILPEEEEYDPYSLILNEALQWWRDVVVMQMQGGQILLQESADEEVVVIGYH